MKQRLDYMDVVKGFTILLVILGHSSIPDLLHRFIFSFHMPIFFLISGYFFNVKPLYELISRRGKQLLRPYVLTCLAIILLSSIMCLIGLNHIGLLGNLKMWLFASFYGAGNDVKIFGIRRIGAIWFLLAMFWASLTVNWAVKYKIGGVLILIIAIIGYKTSRIVWLPFSIQAGMTASVYLYLGYLIKKYGNLNKWLQMKLLIPVSLLGWGIGIYFGCGHLYMVSNYYGKHGWDVIVSLIASCAVIAICYHLDKKQIIINKFWNFCGNHSLAILCFHLIELNCISWYPAVHKLFGISNSINATWIVFPLKVIWALGLVLLMIFIKDKVRLPVIEVGEKREDQLIQSRSKWADIGKGIAIILMIVGHLAIPGTLRNIIFSFHMPLFFFISGYFTKTRSYLVSVHKALKNYLIPYTAARALMLFSGLWIYLYYGKRAAYRMSDIIAMLKGYVMSWLMGMSFSSAILKSVWSVGPVWFVICLFFAKLMFDFIISKVHSKKMQAVIVSVLTCLGWYIGKHIAFLPYSFDVSLVSLIFLYSGLFCRQMNWSPANLSTMKIKLGILVMAVIWLVGLHFGGIELAIRKYPVFPICLFAAISGTMLVFYLSAFLEKNTFFSDVLSFYGEYSLIVLVVHLIEGTFVHWNLVALHLTWWKLGIIKGILITSCVVLWILLRKTNFLASFGIKDLVRYAINKIC